MKRWLGWLMVAVLAGGARAADVSITNWLSGYKMVSASCTNTGESGLSVGTAYACIPLGSLTGTTEGNAGETNVTSDVRQLVYSFADAVYLKWETLDVTNRPTRMKVAKGVSYIGGLSNRVFHTVENTTVSSGSTMAGE